MEKDRNGILLESFSFPKEELVHLSLHESTHPTACNYGNDPYDDIDVKETLNQLPREILNMRNQLLKQAMNLPWSISTFLIISGHENITQEPSLGYVGTCKEGERKREELAASLPAHHSLSISALHSYFLMEYPPRITASTSLPVQILNSLPKSKCRFIRGINNSGVFSKKKGLLIHNDLDDNSMVSMSSVELYTFVEAQGDELFFLFSFF